MPRAAYPPVLVRARIAGCRRRRKGGGERAGPRPPQKDGAVAPLQPTPPISTRPSKPRRRRSAESCLPVCNGGARRSSSAAGGTTASCPGPWQTSRSRCRCSASSTCCRCCTRTKPSPGTCRSTLTRSRSHLPSAVRLGLEISQPNSVLGKALALNARSQLARACRSGSSPARRSKKCWPRSRELRKQGFAFTLDILGEAMTSEREADAYQQSLSRPDRGHCAARCNAWPEVPQIDRDHDRQHSAGQRSVKLSALDSQFDPIDPEGTAEHVKQRLRALAAGRPRARAYVHVDME